jgi:hypothetical protein
MNPNGFNKTKRLSKDTGYVRPKKTLQDTLSNNDIKDKLKEYTKVSDIRKVIIGTHIRYFTKDKDTKKPVFRLGGFLTKFGEDYKYVILSNGSISWSVQNNNDTQFWSKMNSKQIANTIETEIEERVKDENKDLEEKFKKLKEKNDYMKKLLEEQQHEKEKLEKKIKEIEIVAKNSKSKK